MRRVLFGPSVWRLQSLVSWPGLFRAVVQWNKLINSWQQESRKRQEENYLDPNVIVKGTVLITLLTRSWQSSHHLQIMMLGLSPNTLGLEGYLACV